MIQEEQKMVQNEYTQIKMIKHFDKERVTQRMCSHIFMHYAYTFYFILLNHFVFVVIFFVQLTLYDCMYVFCVTV